MVRAGLNSSARFFLSRKREYVDRLSAKLDQKNQVSTRRAFYHGFQEQEDVLHEGKQQIAEHLEKSIHQKISWAKNLAIQKVLNNLTNNPTVIVAMAIDALSNVACATDVEIRCASVHEPILKEHLAYIAAQCSTVRNVKVTKDPSIPLGSLLVRANKSIINRNLLFMADEAEHLLKSNGQK